MNYYRPGRTVYAHCNVGLGRSPSVAIAYLVWRQRWNLDEAVEHVTRNADPARQNRSHRAGRQESRRRGVKPATKPRPVVASSLCQTLFLRPKQDGCNRTVFARAERWQLHGSLITPEKTRRRPVLARSAARQRARTPASNSAAPKSHFIASVPFERSGRSEGDNPRSNPALLYTLRRHFSRRRGLPAIAPCGRSTARIPGGFQPRSTPGLTTAAAPNTITIVGCGSPLASLRILRSASSRASCFMKARLHDRRRIPWQIAARWTSWAWPFVGLVAIGFADLQRGRADSAEALRHQGGQDSFGPLYNPIPPGRTTFVPSVLLRIACHTRQPLASRFHFGPNITVSRSTQSARVETLLGATEPRAEQPVAVWRPLVNHQGLQVSAVDFPVYADVWADALLVTPDGESPLPVVIACHGDTSSPESICGEAPIEVDRFAQYLASQGFAVLAPRFVPRSNDHADCRRYKGDMRHILHRMSFPVGRHPSAQTSTLSVRRPICWRRCPRSSICRGWRSSVPARAV